MTERISSLNCLRISTIKSNKYNTKVYLFIICVDKERWDMKMNGPLTKALDLKACLCAVNAFSISSTFIAGHGLSEGDCIHLRVRSKSLIHKDISRRRYMLYAIN